MWVLYDLADTMLGVPYVSVVTLKAKQAHRCRLTPFGPPELDDAPAPLEPSGLMTATGRAAAA